MMRTKTKNWTPKIIALAVVCLVIGVGIGLVGYHYLFGSDFSESFATYKIVSIEAGPIAYECFNKSYLIETADYIIEGTIEKVEVKQDMETGIYSYVYLTIDGYFKGKPLLVKGKVADMLQINVSVRAPYNFTPYEGKKVRIYLRKWSEGDIRLFCGYYGIEEIKQ